MSTAGNSKSPGLMLHLHCLPVVMLGQKFLPDSFPGGFLFYTGILRDMATVFVITDKNHHLKALCSVA